MKSIKEFECMRIKENANLVVGGADNKTTQADGKTDKLIHSDDGKTIIGVKTNVDWNPFNNDQRDR